jgi:hypothetical protein
MTEAERHRYDRSSKWLIQHHGDSILRLANIEGIERWRPVQTEVVQPRQLPDGLLEVRLHGEEEDDLFLLEVATYPERRVGRQLSRDTMMVYLDRGVLPEVVVLVLRPKGRYRVPAETRLRSRQGFSSSTVRRRVVELWRVPADALLEAGDVGLAPWLVLAETEMPPAKLAERCRDLIEQRAAPEERENLFAVVQVLAGLRYNDPVVFEIFGGRKTMIESPIIQGIVAEALHRAIVDLLTGRFGELPADLERDIRTVVDEDRLVALNRIAASCTNLDAFRQALDERLDSGA